VIAKSKVNSKESNTATPHSPGALVMSNPPKRLASDAFSSRFQINCNDLRIGRTYASNFIMGTLEVKTAYRSHLQLEILQGNTPITVMIFDGKLDKRMGAAGIGAGDDVRILLDGASITTISPPTLNFPNGATIESPSNGQRRSQRLSIDPNSNDGRFPSCLLHCQ
jgi:hypothetical protein